VPEIFHEDFKSLPETGFGFLARAVRVALARKAKEIKVRDIFWLLK
jgi:hypothetical protein